jgi:hypothetical protein
MWQVELARLGFSEKSFMTMLQCFGNFSRGDVRLIMYFVLPMSHIRTPHSTVHEPPKTNKCSKNWLFKIIPDLNFLLVNVRTIRKTIFGKLSVHYC